MGYTKTEVIRKTYKAKVSSGRHVDQTLTFPWRGIPEPGSPARFAMAAQSLLKIVPESILGGREGNCGLYGCQTVWLLYASEFPCLHEFPKKANCVAPANLGDHRKLGSEAAPPIQKKKPSRSDWKLTLHAVPPAGRGGASGPSELIVRAKQWVPRDIFRESC